MAVHIPLSFKDSVILSHITLLRQKHVVIIRATSSVTTELLYVRIQSVKVYEAITEQVL